MKPDATKYFVCPSCCGDLTLESDQSGAEIESGTLQCAPCKQNYPIIRGVPRFVYGEEYADTFGRQWSRWSTTQHDSLNGTWIFRDRLTSYSGWTLESMAGEVVVDAGCGPGGFIDVVRPFAATIVGFDLSGAIDSAYRNHGKWPNVYLAQGDIFNPPIRRQVANRLFSFGVVQHTPNPEAAFRSLTRLVKPDGQIAVWVYRKWPLPHPTYVLRWFTRGMQEPRATKFIEWYTPKAMKLARAIGCIPLVGKQLRRLVPVADYRGNLPLSDDQLREWALMDTHDALITRYTYPQAWSDLQRWTRGLIDVTRPSRSQMSVVARIPKSR
jgi:SAM-dependent methyltransferase